MKLADIEARRRYQAERQAHRDRLRRRAVFAVFEWMAGWTR